MTLLKDFFAPSADGKGRTVWQRLRGENVKDSRPLELQYFNPMKLVVGRHVTLDHESAVRGIDFTVTGIFVYETNIGDRKFYHTDYDLVGQSLSETAPIKMRMRLEQDENQPDGYKIQMFRLFEELGSDKTFYEMLNAEDENGEHVFLINNDGDTDLETPWKYWRIDDITEPYQAEVVEMKDADRSGSIEDSELKRRSVEFWDFSRETTDAETNEPFVELFWVEMDKDSGYFKMYLGKDVRAFQVSTF
jgi:hypothetical protein